jgi:hypothetical protein
MNKMKIYLFIKINEINKSQVRKRERKKDGKRNYKH